jgi:hypothetical protein
LPRLRIIHRVARAPTSKSLKSLSGGLCVNDVTWLLWIDRGKTVATFLVAIGVAAEFAFAWIEGPARKRLDDAKEVRIAEAEARAAEANREASELRKQAETERLARVKIEEKLAPRHLTTEQKRSIAGKLNRFRGHVVNLMTFSTDAEVVRFSADIEQALAGANGAGWRP